MNPIASHMSILNLILHKLPINNVIEFGMGLNSTILFSNKLNYGISIEMQDQNWYNKVKSIINNKNWKLIWLPGPNDAIEYVKSDNKQFDLMFVDGHGESRWKCINMGFNKQIPIIVAHDTEQPSYQWNKVIVPKEYKLIDYIHKTLNRGCTIFTKYDVNFQPLDDHNITDFNWKINNES